ncbi:hypothetical protein B6D12_07290 [Gilliamella apicola]|uniref:hypothetical protein n=1 Tax=Gilliamella TaxID=1193503 RepID=UPI000810CE8D|nr:hypothetical protein [Gilliamella apicola]OCF92568.1 hypothetical protein A9G17_05270 [Gilliamella apicola]OTP90054.1 hypothetical protein B5S41_05150 [Gilliamella apicola]OTP92305.1 hypothetical protein B6D05_12455 [Gilliamella apicola]OTP94127.1 hypothetical protein B6D13_08365 [Gilliamella apicola]OTP99037.1 hypothetical protein B6D07_12435 [Gilliamella apicola]
MVSFAKMGIFEQATKLPMIESKELALLLCGLDPYIKIKEIPQDKLADFRSYRNYIERCLSSYGGGFYQKYSSDIMFTIAYTLIDEEVTPEPVKQRALKAIINITGTQKWRETLYKLGGQELLDTGTDLSKSQRGMYKKDEEQTNIYKMTGMLLKLIADKQSNSYGTAEKPNIAVIKKAIDEMAKKHNLNLDGLSKSSFYEKAKLALSYTQN